jgi:hypothetical protein
LARRSRRRTAGAREADPIGTFYDHGDWRRAVRPPVVRGLQGPRRNAPAHRQARRDDHARRRACARARSPRDRSSPTPSTVARPTRCAPTPCGKNRPAPENIRMVGPGDQLRAIQDGDVGGRRLVARAGAGLPGEQARAHQPVHDEPAWKSRQLGRTRAPGRHSAAGRSW